MKHEEIIQELQDLAAQLNVTIRYERGDFEGGYCILKEKRILLVNRRLMPMRKAPSQANIGLGPSLCHPRHLLVDRLHSKFIDDAATGFLLHTVINS